MASVARTVPSTAPVVAFGAARVTLPMTGAALATTATALGVAVNAGGVP